MAARISVIVPAFNEERYLPRLLAGVGVARRRYRRGAEAVEVIVADNGSADATARIAREHGCEVVHVATRRIGAVRNAGARAASAGRLAFVDADFGVHPDTFNAIEDYLDDERHVVGLSGCVPERTSAPIEMSWWMLGALTALAGYGVPLRRSELMPSGVVCCRREDWDAVGGYCERRTFAEDVRFVLDLQDLGRRRGQRAGWLRGAPAVCSTRKFDQFGDWHYLTLPARLALWACFDRAAVQRWAERYWYGAQRQR